MYDFNRFMSSITYKTLSEKTAYEALEIVKEPFYIGKIGIRAVGSKRSFDLILDEHYDKNIFLSYESNGYLYNFHKDKTNHKYTDEEVKDIQILLRLIGLYHANSIIKRKAENAEYISRTTQLLNEHGYLRDINKLFNEVDFENYNSYCINIKGFGLVNKLFGIEEGDRAMKQYARALKNFVNEDELVGHLNGDNFVAFVRRDKHKEFIDLVTSCPVVLQKEHRDTTISLTGVVGFYEVKATDLPVYVISNASMALQYARSTRKKVIQHTVELSEMVNSVKIIERSFKKELDDGNLLVYYQPKFDIETGKINGVESLARWIHNGNVIHPGLFVPILEKNGEIIDLDLFVLENLCKDIDHYRSLGNKIVPASCNLSRSDFTDEHLEEKIIAIIKKYDVRSEDIVIEVTETTNLDENERLARFINTMHQNGIRTSIDDFGTGYSSLSVLRDFKVNEIKIDRSFINRDVLSDSDEIILGAIIDMAKRLKINVICEGVETKEQADFLMKLGCNNAQGYLYSKPVPKAEFEDMLKKSNSI